MDTFPNIAMERGEDDEDEVVTEARSSSSLDLTSKAGSSITQVRFNGNMVNDEDDVSSVSGSDALSGGMGSMSLDEDDGSSLDSIGNMLVRVVDNDASLTELLIDCKSIDDDALKYVEQFLPMNTHIKRLRVRNHRRNEYRQIFRKVLSSLKSNSSVKSLEIQGVEVDAEVASWLLPFLGKQNKLDHISMMNCGGAGLEGLFVAMQHNQHLKHLTFRSCYWDEHIADIVASSLPFMNLRSLSLVNIVIAEDGWPYVFRKVQECIDLTCLDLSRNKLDSSTISMLMSVMKHQRSLLNGNGGRISKLKLMGCHLDDDCLKELCTGLMTMDHVTSLDISYNHRVTERGVQYLRALLQANISIKEVNAKRCNLTSQSSQQIENGVRFNNSLVKRVSFAVYKLLSCASEDPVTLDDHRDPHETGKPGLLPHNIVVQDQERE